MRDFVAAWDKVMNLDRFDVSDCNVTSDSSRDGYLGNVRVTLLTRRNADERANIGRIVTGRLLPVSRYFVTRNPCGVSLRRHHIDLGPDRVPWTTWGIIERPDDSGGRR